MKNNIFLDGLRSVARVGETAVIAARAVLSTQLKNQVMPN